MRRFFYFLACYITSPVNWIISLFVPDWCLKWAVRALFYNDWQYIFVLSQFGHETGMFGSPLYIQHNNPAGIGYSVAKHPKGIVDTKRPGEPKFASFRTIYGGVYDYYLLINGIKKVKTALENTPGQSYEYKSKSMADYFSSVVSALKASNYFTADATAYYSSLVGIARNFKTRMGLFWVSNIISICILYFLFIVGCRYYRRH